MLQRGFPNADILRDAAFSEFEWPMPEKQVWAKKLHSEHSSD